MDVSLLVLKPIYMHLMMRTSTKSCDCALVYIRAVCQAPASEPCMPYFAVAVEIWLTQAQILETASKQNLIMTDVHVCRGEWNYLTVQLARTSEDEDGDPDLYGMFTGGTSGQVLTHLPTSCL